MTNKKHCCVGEKKTKFKKRTKVKLRLSKKSRKSNKTRKSRKYKKGGNGFTNCCMCEKNVDIKNTLVPRVCLQKYGKRAHRICSECWWNPVTGFAREDAPHGCPGCIKHLPLTEIEPSESVLIDLSEDDN